MLQRNLFFWLLLLCFTTGLKAQIQIEGRVLNAKTAKPIPFLSMGIKNTSSGTLTNEQGEFVLKTTRLPVVIITSHLGYQTVEVTITKGDGNEIRLTEAVHNLAEVKVTNLAEKLLRQAYEKNWANRKQSVYGNAFYRQTTKTEEDYTELHEVFYASRMNSIAVKGLKIKQARYAKIKSTAENPTFTFLNLSYAVWGYNQKAQRAKPAPDRLIVPCRADVADYFDLTINDITTHQNQDIYEIDCKPRAGNPPAHYFSGRVFINRTTSNILKIEGDLGDGGMSGQGFENAKMTFDYRFRELPAGFSVLDYGKVVFSGNLSAGKKSKVITQATLVLYEMGEIFKEKSLKKLNINKEDLAEILKIKYDAEFWKNNPIIKRTALEDQIIKSFEGKGAFGNILE